MTGAMGAMGAMGDRQDLSRVVPGGQPWSQMSQGDEPDPGSPAGNGRRWLKNKAMT